MIGSVDVRADSARGPGHALIRVRGAAACADPRFRISRSPEWPASNLGPSGWQGSEALLRPLDSRRDGADLVLAVGPAVCDVLEPDNYYFGLPATGLSTAMHWPDEVLPGHSEIGASPFPPAPPVASPPPRSTPDVRPPPIPQPPPPEEQTVVLVRPPEPPPRVAAKVGIGVLVLLIALVVAAFVVRPWTASWWPWQAAQPEPTPTPTPTTTPPPADLDTMSVADLARGDPSNMLAQAQRRIADKPQEALLLLEVAGSDRHFGPALSALGRLYDPALPRQGGIPADPRQSAKAYQDAARHHDDSASAEREALHQKLLQQRDTGDTNAKLILQDFWP